MSIRTPSWLKRLPAWSRGHDFSVGGAHEHLLDLDYAQELQVIHAREEREREAKAFFKASHAHHDGQAPKREPTQAEALSRLYSSLATGGGETEAQLHALQLERDVKGGVRVLPHRYTCAQLMLDAQERASCRVASGLTKLSPQKEQFAQVLRTARAQAHAHALSLASTDHHQHHHRNSPHGRHQAKRPPLLGSRQRRASTSPRLRRAVAPTSSASVNSDIGADNNDDDNDSRCSDTDSDDGKVARRRTRQEQRQRRASMGGFEVMPERKVVGSMATHERRPSFNPQEYRTLRPAERVRRRLDAYRESSIRLRQLHERTTLAKAREAAERRKFRQRLRKMHEEHKLQQQLLQSGEATTNGSAGTTAPLSKTDARVAASRQRFHKHWRAVMAERVEIRDRRSPAALEQRVVLRRAKFLATSVSMAARAGKMHAALAVVKQRQAHWRQHARRKGLYHANNPVARAANTLAAWWRWSPKPRLRARWLAVHGSMRLRELAEYRVSKGADTLAKFLRDLNRKAWGLKTRAGSAIDLRLMMHRFYQKTCIIQRCALRFTKVRRARLDLLELKWEAVEWQLAVAARDRHVSVLRAERDEKRRQARAEEQVRQRLDAKEAAEVAGLVRLAFEEGSDVKDKGMSVARVPLDDDTMGIKRGLECKLGLGSRRRSSTKWVSGGAGSLGRTNMKVLMDAQLSSSLDAANHTPNERLANKTTDELATLLVKGLTSGEKRLVERVLDTVGHRHDDLDTASGGFPVEQFLRRVDGDLRRDSLEGWLRRHMREVRNKLDAEHAEAMEEWRLDTSALSLAETQRLFFENAGLKLGNGSKNKKRKKSDTEAEQGSDSSEEESSEDTRVPEDNRTGGDAKEEGEGGSTWSKIEKMIHAGKIDLHLTRGGPKAPPYPPVLLLTGASWDEQEFREMVRSTLDRARYG